MADKKYKVADGVALTVKGVVLGAGEAIPQTDAGVNVLDADTIKTLVAAKKIVEDKGEAIPENTLEDSTIQTLVKAKKIVEDKSETKSDEKNADDKKSDEKNADGKSEGKK